MFEEVLDGNWHAKGDELGQTLGDPEHQLSIALKKIDLLARGEIGPKLTVATSDKNLSLSEILDKTLLETLLKKNMEDMPDSELREKISSSLKAAGISDSLVEQMFDHFSLPLKTSAFVTQNLHVLHALGIPNQSVFSLLLQGENANEPSRTKVRNTVSAEQDPFYLGLVFKEIRSIIEDETCFDSLLQQFLDSPQGDTLENNTRLKQIRKNCVENARSYVSMKQTVLTQSLEEYANQHGSSFPEIRFSETALKAVSRKISTETLGDLRCSDDVSSLAYNCFHCPPTCIEKSTKKESSKFLLDADFALSNVFRFSVLKTFEEVDKHYSTLHSKKKCHKFLLVCLKCVKEKKPATSFSCCLPCAKTHYTHLHASNDPFHLISTELESSFRKDPCVLESIKTYFDVRCRLCYRFFSTNSKRDLHESRLCLTRAISLSAYYGTKLNLTTPLSNDFCDGVVSRMEEEFVLQQANLLMSKQKVASDEPFFSANETVATTTTTTTTSTDECKSLKTYLREQTSELITLKGKKNKFPFIPRDIKDKSVKGEGEEEEEEERDEEEDEEEEEEEEGGGGGGRDRKEDEKEDEDEDRKKKIEEEKEGEKEEKKEERKMEEKKKEAREKEERSEGIDGNDDLQQPSTSGIKERNSRTKKTGKRRKKNPFIDDMASCKRRDISASSSSSSSSSSLRREQSAGSSTSVYEESDVEDDEKKKMMKLIQRVLSAKKQSSTSNRNKKTTKSRQRKQKQKQKTKKHIVVVSSGSDSDISVDVARPMKKKRKDKK